MIWDPERTVEIAQGPRHDNAGYTPYAGRTLKGWPETVLRRGQVIVAAGELLPAPGRGRFLPRAGGPAASPARSAGAGAGPGAQFRRRAGAPIIGLPRLRGAALGREYVSSFATLVSWLLRRFQLGSRRSACDEIRLRLAWLLQNHVALPRP